MWCYITIALGKGNEMSNTYQKMKDRLASLKNKTNDPHILSAIRNESNYLAWRMDGNGGVEQYKDTIFASIDAYEKLAMSRGTK